jgi:GWxTD domain-containing protein
MKEYVLMCAVLLAVLVPFSAAPETFEGEDELVARLPSKELTAYFELKILLNPLQMRQYLMLTTSEERRAWIERFWVEHDPTPTSEVNERRLEHERRILIARSYFPSFKTPGWDDRGEAIVRWGIPSYRTNTAGSVDENGVTPPGEVWYYSTYQMLIRFMDFTLTNAYCFVYGTMPHAWTSLDELRVAQRLREPARASEEKRLAPIPFLDPQDHKNALNNTDLNEIDYWRDPAYLEHLHNYEWMNDLVADIESDEFQTAQGNFSKFVDEQPVIYASDLVENTLPLFFDVASFKDQARGIRAEISFEVPSSAVQPVPKGDERTAEIEFSAIVRDYDFNEVASGRDLVDPSAATYGPVPSQLIPGQVVLSLEPGCYRIGVEAYDRDTGKRAAATRTVRIEPVAGSPAISDIQFAGCIRDAGRNAKFAKGSLQVVPHPQRGYRIHTPVNCYFEVYRLDTNDGGKAFYRVEYRIVPLEKRRWGPVLIEVPATISSAFETSGYGATQSQRISIATDELWRGPFRLEVTVTDRRTFRSASRSSEFSIVE